MTSEHPSTIEMPNLLAAPAPTRRGDVEAKQRLVARLLEDAGCEGLLVLEPANFRWLTCGAAARGGAGPDEAPALYFNVNQRWLLCSSVDTQRFFDEDLDGLGFQVKEWPWSGSREQHFADVCFNRRVASDRPFRDCKLAGGFFEQERRRLGPFERACARELGRLLAHALEATARNIGPGDTEEEVAGHLAHRLLKRGAEPAALQVAADERPRDYRRAGVSAAPVRRRCLLQATAAKFGLYVTAGRTVCFGAPAEGLRQEFDTASQVVALWHSCVRAEHRPAALYEATRNLLKGTAFADEWRLAPAGWWAGRRPSEGLLTAASADRFAAGHLVVWQARVGGAAACDTFLLDENGWNPVTAVEEWPVRRYVIQGTRFDRPDLLVRHPS